MGYAILVFWFGIEFSGRCALLTDLYLMPPYRMKGFGSHMLRRIEEYCIKSGLRSLQP